MNYTTEDIMRMRSEALQDRLNHTTVQITVVRIGLQFTIDNRDTLRWKKHFDKIGERVEFTDISGTTCSGLKEKGLL